MTEMNGLSLELGKYQKQVDIRLKQMQKQDFVSRLWDKDEDLWVRKNQDRDTVALGWLTSVKHMIKEVPHIQDFCAQVAGSGIDHIVLLGMGGSSLAPYVLYNTMEPSEQRIRFIVLDSTDPETIKKTESEINIATTLFIVSSKSGGTAEVSAFFNYFFKLVYDIKGEHAGEHFIAITDEASPLETLAKEKKFLRTFLNPPRIGGRYSALSYFGLVPAALVGIDIGTLLKRTLKMVKACGPDVPAMGNPGVILGTAIAELALRGRDKLTYIIPSRLAPFGTWLEQLIAESTGKNGKGILPLYGDPSIESEYYGKDRLLFRLGLEDEDMPALGMEHPSFSIRIKDELDLGKEFFRWEIATATAGAILGVNPFDQPNVEESKKITNRLLQQAEASGHQAASLTEGPIRYYSNEKASDGKTLIKNFLAGTYPGDYMGLLAFLPETNETIELLEKIRLHLHSSMKIAVSMQFGPRYLHSTGQYHKGGPGNGTFIQFVSGSQVDVRIPGKTYSFGMLKRAQAFGDMEALLKNQRRVILIDLGEDFSLGLKTFLQQLEQTLLPHKQEVAQVYSFNNKEEKAA
jgi:transaldolase/glucose-6-phosphate isomerase